MLKVGIIRCQQTEDVCAGSLDFKMAREGKAAFESTGPAEVMGFVSCGGCPGKRAVFRARMLVKNGAQAIAFASCVGKGTPIGMPCPHFDAIKQAIAIRIGPNIPLIEWTH